MTKLKLSSKMHLFIIISSLIIAIGLAVGTICHFVAGGFFNYGNEFNSYKSVTVRYDYLGAELNKDIVKDICDGALDDFAPLEVSYFEYSSANEVVYKFPESTDANALKSAVEKINQALAEKDSSGFAVATYASAKTLVGGERVLVYASIALASSVVFHLIYVALRYGVNRALSALIADCHNLGIFVALAAITRIPVGINLVAFAVAVVIVTIITSCLFFDRIRKNGKDETYKKLTDAELTDLSAGECVTTNTIFLCALAIAAVVAGIFAAIAATHIAAITPYVAALFAVIACFYGSVFFTPSVHSRLNSVFKRRDSAGKQKKQKSAADKAK